MTSNGLLRGGCRELGRIRSRKARVDSSKPWRYSRAVRRSNAGHCEALRGLTMRRAIKRFVMTAYCWGLLPAWLVAFVFRVFRLKHV